MTKLNQIVNFLAIDLGATSGRMMVAGWDGEGFKLEELHRFPNGPVELDGHLHWEVFRLWHEIKLGLARYATSYGLPLAGIGVDSWAVDFVLLDKAGSLLELPYHYRDNRTEGLQAQVFKRLSRNQLFAATGIQFLPFNTLYQLYAMRPSSGSSTLAQADSLLMIPDLFHFWLSGRKVTEYTNATTTQFFHAKEGRWATELLAALELPTRMLSPIVPPGTFLGELRSEIQRETGLNQPVPIIAPATHDTASAVAAIPGLDERSAYISSGTWSLVGLEIAQPLITPATLALNFTNEGGVNGTIRLLKNVAGLWLLQECQRQWAQVGQNYSWDELARAAQQAPAFRSLVDPDAAEFLNPANMIMALQQYCRRTAQPIPESVGQLTRCCLESLALKYRTVVESLAALTGRKLEVIRVVGGGSQNELLCQFTANACGREVVAGPVEATALGNVLLQALATGHLADLATGRQAIASSIRLKSFMPGETKEWAEAFDRFCQLETA